MGLSLKNQVDTNKFFCYSDINKNMMEKAGINMSVTDFKDLVKRSPPYMVIQTGSEILNKKQRNTKVYRFQDFLTK